VLIERGIGPDTVVAVAIPRSLALMTAVYAVLKAGAAVVAIDAEHPAERIAQILDNAKPACALVVSNDPFELPAGLPVIDIAAGPTDGYRDGPVGDRGAHAPAHLADLCWIVYTSGRPVPRRGSRSRTGRWSTSCAGFRIPIRSGPVTGCCTRRRFTFDMAGWEMFGPLQTGAAVVLAETGGHRDAHYLARLMPNSR